jgi:hypothetical protein
VAAKSPEARKTLRDLDKELAEASSRLGQTLVWSAAEASVIAQLAPVLERERTLAAWAQTPPDAQTQGWEENDAGGIALRRA